MSDSEASVSLPSSSKIEQTLITVLTRIFKSGNHVDLTVKRIRKFAEEELDLEEDFFKSNDEWNKKSKALIVEEVVRLLVANRPAVGKVRKRRSATSEQSYTTQETQETHEEKYCAKQWQNSSTAKAKEGC
jgi:hypothetical protein